MVHAYTIPSLVQDLRTATEDAYQQKHGRRVQLQYFSEIARAAEALTNGPLPLQTVESLLLALTPSQLFPQSYGIDPCQHGFSEPVILYDKRYAYGAMLTVFGKKEQIWPLLNQEIRVADSSVSHAENDGFDY
ncbi:MAG: hypothetical protein HY832_04100 [Candidatus Aenigmarchaeota archaeon]|nr:hypothetical protein [Candidatus Aenigmarchaeota archaeon]